MTLPIKMTKEQLERRREKLHNAISFIDSQMIELRDRRIDMKIDILNINQRLERMEEKK